MSPKLEGDNVFDILKLKCIYQVFRKHKGTWQLNEFPQIFVWVFKVSLSFFYTIVKQNNS